MIGRFKIFVNSAVVILVFSPFFASAAIISIQPDASLESGATQSTTTQRVLFTGGGQTAGNVTFQVDNYNNTDDAKYALYLVGPEQAGGTDHQHLCAGDNIESGLEYEVNAAHGIQTIVFNCSHANEYAGGYTASTSAFTLVSGETYYFSLFRNRPAGYDFKIFYGVGTVAYYEFDDCVGLGCVGGGGGGGGNSGATSTHIQTVTPSNGSTIATSSTATFAATGYIALNDYVTGGYIEVKYAPYSSALISVANSDGLFTTLHFPVSQAGTFSVSTTSPATRGGQYTMTTKIIMPPHSSILGAIGGVLFGLFGNISSVNTTVSATSTKFIAGQRNQYDTFVASTTDSINTYLASSTISLSSCSFSLNFSLPDCMALIFLPQWEPISDSLKDFKDGFLSYAPWGYLTRMVVILTGSATSSLPMITAQVPLGDPADGHFFNLSLDPNDMLAGGAAAADSITSTYGPSVSIRDVYEPYVKLNIVLALFMYILFDLINLRHIAAPSRGRSGHLS